MAETIAIGSKQGARTKPKGSRTLLCALRHRLPLKQSKNGQAVSKIDEKRRILVPLIPETAHPGSRGFRTGTSQDRRDQRFGDPHVALLLRMTL